MLPGSWIDQDHKIGTIKVLPDAIELTALRDTQVQQQISVLAPPQFWNYRVTDSRWRQCFEGENKSFNLYKMAERSTLSEKSNVNGEQNERLSYCILSTVKDHHCNFCKMSRCKLEIGKKERKRLDRLYVKKLRNNAIIPCRGTHGASGYDLSSVQDLIISGKGKGVVKTGLTIAIPEDTYARIAPRSGLAVKQFIDWVQV